MQSLKECEITKCHEELPEDPIRVTFEIEKFSKTISVCAKHGRLLSHSCVSEFSLGFDGSLTPIPVQPKNPFQKGN